MFFCSECGEYFSDENMAAFECKECADWLNQDWVDFDDTPTLLVRYNDGGVVCSYKEFTAIIMDYDLPHYAPYKWLKKQLDSNSLLYGLHLDPYREYAYNIDDLVDMILTKNICIDIGDELEPVIR